ncbi:M1 family metallopeptidase [Psychroflexus sp. S27]|uniref:M1 family metallopeptidase n=1 Tax=Psychroflexus sp. S27 TaxID=1982757 RepID=UPI001863C96D|nr:M1 family metallopeptidase [Psychroflexus sp. S27]
MKSFSILFFFLLTSFAFSQSQSIDVQNITAHVTINPDEKQISADYRFSFLTKSKLDTVFLDAKNLENIKFVNTEFEIYNSGNKLFFIGNFKKDKSYTFDFSYQVKPKQTVYFIKKLPEHDNSAQVWTQGQGKYTSHWLPSLDDMTDKIIFNLSYTFPDQYELTANGALVSEEKNENLLTRHFEMKNPMSSYLVAFAVGNFKAVRDTTDSGVPLKMYLPEQYNDYFRFTYQNYNEIFSILEDKIGVAYPWQNYKQVPVRDFLYAGMENTGLTIFSEEFIVDEISYNDQNFTNVHAHELAHQWFGNSITEKSSVHHWLQEGFATYFALLVEQELFGNAYFENQLFEDAEQLKLASDRGEGEKIMSKNASSLTYYKKGAWALHALRNRIGDAVFFDSVKDFLNQNAYQIVEVDDFLKIVEEKSGQSMLDFKKEWLLQTSFPAEEALSILGKSEFIDQLFKLKLKRGKPLKDKILLIKNALLSRHNAFLGPEAVLQIIPEKGSQREDLLYLAFSTGNIETRQFLAKNLKQISKDLKEKYEDLLKDQSYVTREHALLNLWMNFPEDRRDYLAQMKGQEGTIHKNIELLWLMLKVTTEKSKEARKAFHQLTDYTDSAYAYQIKRQAFIYLFQIDKLTDQSIINLSKDLNHSVWRYRNFVKQLLTELIKDQNHRADIIKLLEKDQLSNKEKVKDILKV